MAKNLFSLKQLLDPLSKVGGMTMISRILGFGRDIALTALLGASATMDAFLIAFRFPNIFRSLFAEGAFSAAFVPLFVAIKQKKGSHYAFDFAVKVFKKLTLFLLVFSIIMITFMPQVMWYIAPGFRESDANSMGMVVSFARISFSYLLFMSVASLLAGILNSHGHFWRGSLASSFLNICLILVAGFYLFLLVIRQDMTGAHIIAKIEWLLKPMVIGQFLSLAIIASGLWQVIFLWRGVKGLNQKFWQEYGVPKNQREHKQKSGGEEKKLLTRMAPAMFGAGGQQLNALVGDIIATTIGVGAVTHLFYADRLVQLPLGVIGVALSIVLLQRFSHAQHGKKVAMAKMPNILQQGLVLGLVFALPACLALHFLGQYFVPLLFERGAFDSTASQKTASALQFFAIALPFYISNKVFQPYFYSLGDTKTPVKITLLSLMVNGSLAYILAQYFAESGIAIASLISAGMASAIFLGLLLWRGKINFGWIFWKPILLIILLNSPLLLFYHWLAGGIMGGGLLLLLIAIGGSALYYFPLLYGLRNHVESLTNQNLLSK